MIHPYPQAKLGEAGIADLILGQSPPSSTYNKEGMGLPFYQGKADFGSIHPRERIWCSVPEKTAAADDILISVRAPVGDVNMATADCAIGRGVVALRADAQCHNWFLFYAMRHIKGDLERKATGSTFASINKDTLSETEIPFPNLSIQRGIALALRFIDGKIIGESSVEQAARKVKRDAMAILFSRGLRGERQKETEIGPTPESWELTTFRQIREWLQYGTSCHCTKDSSLRYPVLRIPNIEQGKIDDDDLKYCDMPENEAQRYLLASGDLIFVRTNGVKERLGNCAVYDGQPNTVLFASYLIRARLAENIIPRFVACFYGSPTGATLVADRATPAADGKYNLNTAIIDSLPIPIPGSREEQKEIVSVLDAIDRKIDLHRRKRAVLEELFKAMLHKLMTGQIRSADLDLSALDGLETGTRTFMG